MADGHRPIYTTSSSPSVVSVGEQQRASFEALLVKYQARFDISHGTHIRVQVWGCCLTLHALLRRSTFTSPAMTTSMSARECAMPLPVLHAVCLEPCASQQAINPCRCPIYNGTCQPNLADGSLGGPVYAVVGNAGFTLSYLPNPYLPPYWEVWTRGCYQACMDCAHGILLHAPELVAASPFWHAAAECRSGARLPALHHHCNRLLLRGARALCSTIAIPLCALPLNALHISRRLQHSRVALQDAEGPRLRALSPSFGCTQMISTITGALLDSFTLTKPAGFKPDVAGRTAFLAGFKQTYFPGGPYPGSGTYLETTGA